MAIEPLGEALFDSLHETADVPHRGAEPVDELTFTGGIFGLPKPVDALTDRGGG